jgi:hypothetical protein
MILAFDRVLEPSNIIIFSYIYVFICLYLCTLGNYSCTHTFYKGEYDSLVDI